MDKAEGALLVAERALETARSLADSVAQLRAATPSAAAIQAAAEEAAAEAVAKLPPAPPGQNGKDADPAVIAQLVDEGIAKALPSAVQKALDALVPQIAAKAAELVPKPRDGVDGKPGADGKSVDEVALLTRLTDTVTQLVKAMPVPKDGKDGKDGRDGRDAQAVDVEAIVRQVAAKIPAPKDGSPGKDADPAEIRRMVEEAVAAIPKPCDGVDGKDAPVVDEGAIVERVRALIPTPKDGKDAEPVNVEAIVVEVVKQLPQVKDGRDGRDGVDGESVTLDDIRGILEAETAKWGLDFERRAQDLLQRTIENLPKPKDGIDGKDGRDGADGIAPESFTATLDGRTLTIGFTRGAEAVTQTLRLPIPLDRGGFKKGTKYDEHDVVTYGGSVWIALKETATSPPGDDWRLMVRKGTDGKDAS